jgi:trehalose 6-phosphate synthase/phosphatase
MRVVIVSNRLPFTVLPTAEGPVFHPSFGGLATGLSSFLAGQQATTGDRPEFIWFGWPGATVNLEHQPAVCQHRQGNFDCVPIFLTEDSMQRFYHGFCNKTIWPLFHYFLSLTSYEESYWHEYQTVNRAFAERLLAELKPGDLVWIHDYQLMLLPKLIREQFPEMAIGFFLHIPFPSYELFRLLPAKWRSEIVEGILGASLVGFHTHDYSRHFLSCASREARLDQQSGSLVLRDRVVKVDAFPMGIDFERFYRTAGSAVTEARVAELRARCGVQKIIFSIDRLDYTKGLINRLRGYDLFLKEHPEWRGKVTFLLSVAPSRTGVDNYQAMKEELEQLVGRIAGAHGTMHWNPLIYQYANLGFEDLVARYRLCDVALITPLRDGMNLVAKEFIASRPDQTGVLILSEMAGAAKELDEALLINPFHLKDFSRALEQALTMPQKEQIRRNELLQERLRNATVARWGEDFIHALETRRKATRGPGAHAGSSRTRNRLTRQFQAGKRRAQRFDYDEPIPPFADKRKLKQPAVALLAGLAGNGGQTGIIHEL